MRFKPRGPKLYEAYMRGGDAQVFARLIADTWKRARKGKRLSGAEIRDLTTLAHVLTDLYQEQHVLAGLTTAIELFDAMDAAAPDYVLRPILRGEQAVRYKDLYVATGDLVFLDHAIAICEQLAANEEAGSYMWSVPAANLAAYLNRRFTHAGRIADLDRAMSLLREVLGQPRDPANHAGQTMNLGLLHFTRWQLLKVPRDLEEAIALMEPVARNAPVPPQAKLGFLLNLATCLVERARAGISHGEQAAADLDQADRLIATAYANSTFGGTIKALSCGAKANAISARLDSRTTVEAIDEDIELLEFCAALSAGHPRVQADVRAALARARAARFTLGGQDEDFAAATADFTAICEASRDPVELFTESLAWAQWAEEAQRWDSAAEAFRHLMAALHSLALGQYSREHQETWLRQAPYLADQAAFAMAKTGDVEGAIAAAETGRALLLRTVLAQESEAAALRAAGHAELADTLDQAWMLRLFAADGGREQDMQATTDQYARLLEQSRSLIPAATASAMSAEQVREVAARAATNLVYLCVSPHGTVALVVPRSGPAQLRWLSLTLDTVREKAQSLHGAYTAHRARPSGTSDWMRSLDEVGDWCRHHVWGELEQAVPAGEAVTLLPGGPLRFVPIHLARYPIEGSGDGAGRHLTDFRAVGYAPNASSLASGKRDERGERGDGWSPAGAVVVHDPAGSHAPLAYTAAEAAAIRRRLPDVTSLTGAAATRAAVLSSLRATPLLHFACHGVADPMAPLTSGIELADGRLTVGDLMRHRRGLGGLGGVCVLSACETAVSGAALPNEAVGLPSAFLQAGFTVVLGAHWIVDDVSTALLMARFYDEMIADRDTSLAEALRRAQAWLRDADNDAKAALLPEYAATAHALSPVARRLWGRARVHTHPFYWAALTIHGALAVGDGEP